MSETARTWPVPRPPADVVVIGAGLGGLRTVEQLRQLGYQGTITLVGGEAHPPYDRPPLSKQLLAGLWELDKIMLVDGHGLDDLDVRLSLGQRAVALHSGEVKLADGSVLRADAIVVATGVEARKLPGQPDQIFSLRTLDDALALRAALERADSLLIVGAGFIGAEVASTALGLGVSVTMLEAMPVPMSLALGAQVGRLCGRLITEAGADLRTGTAVRRFHDSGPGMTVELEDGTTLSADVAVVGIGGTPNLQWLGDTGLDFAGGIPCDASGRVEGLNGVWAVGDVSAWSEAGYGRRRHEHWTSTTEQAAAVARDIVGAEPLPRAVPYFWSDQFGMKIQLLGRPDHAESVIQLHGQGLSGGPVKGTVVGYLADGRLIGVAGFGAARLVSRYRASLLNGSDLATALEFASSLADTAQSAIG